MQMIQQL
jgi:uncharacterized membrane protein